MNALERIRKPLAAGAIALAMVAGSIGAVSYAFAQQDDTATPPQVEQQVTPEFEESAPAAQEEAVPN